MKSFTEFTMYTELHHIAEIYGPLYEASKRKHMDMVVANGMKLYNSGRFPLDMLFLKDLNDHDCSKFYSEEFYGAIARHAIQNCGYKPQCQEIHDFAEQSVSTHRSTQSHHPESFDNLEDMDFRYLALMVSDWQACVEEEGKKSAMQWWLQKGSRDYKWSSTQRAEILMLIHFFEDLPAD